MITKADRRRLRDLARKVAEIASLPIMAERREMWKRHNQLERVRPLVLVFPEGAWRELLPEAGLQCEDKRARAMEWELRRRIYQHEKINDDNVIEKTWVVHKVIHSTGWGLEAQHIASNQDTGAWGFDPIIKESADLEKLRFPEIEYDVAATEERLAEAQELFGDILDVKTKGISHISYHLMSIYCQLRGLDQVMLDMYDNPGMLHEAMAFLEEGHHRLVEQYIDLNLLSLNNDETYHSSGGVGYTAELPQEDYEPKHIRPCDIWASAESQEMALVSPKMHAEFVMEYEKRLLQPFGLNGYGCCEDLTHKLDYVFAIPHLRRISIAPGADVEKCGEKLQDDYIFSWKPQPAHLVGDFNEKAIREYIQHALDVTRGCVIEMILKDTHTCEGRPERFTRWTKIAKELAEEY